MRDKRRLWAALTGAPTLSAAVALPCLAQAVALPLRGEGELVAPDTVLEVGRGSVLMDSDRTLRILAVHAGAPEAVLAGAWRSADGETAELLVDAVLGGVAARGNGEIRFRPDGSVEHIAARGRTPDGEFSFRYDNATQVAQGEGGGRGWARGPAVLDAVRHGEGLLVDADGRRFRFDRARLTLGENDEFRLVLEGHTQLEFAGTWRGDPRDNPVPLELGRAMGERSGGVGRAWLRERSWDRDWSFQRVELDGWNDERGDSFRLHFEAGGASPGP